MHSPPSTPSAYLLYPSVYLKCKMFKHVQIIYTLYYIIILTEKQHLILGQILSGKKKKHQPVVLLPSWGTHKTTNNCLTTFTLYKLQCGMLTTGTTMAYQDLGLFKCQVWPSTIYTTHMQLPGYVTHMADIITLTQTSIICWCPKDH